MESPKAEVPCDDPTQPPNTARHAAEVAKNVAHSVGQTVGRVVDAVKPDAAPSDPEPRWPAVVAMFAVGGLRLAMPENLSAGPNWLLIAIVAVLIVPIVLSRRWNNNRLNQLLGYVLSSVVTIDMIWSLWLLLAALPAHKESPADLLRSAGALWLTNILVFASWYWRLDAGGPHARDLRESHTDGAFLFPQMTLPAEVRREMGEGDWSPGFVDYLFLAFNTSTAFSPTDVPVLSRWAKMLMMTQSLISFSTVVLLAARAVNIL
jgi:hypothetical protein